MNSIDGPVAGSQLAPSLSRATLDTAGHRRRDGEWVDRAWADPQTRVLVLESGEGTMETGARALKARQSRALVVEGAAVPELALVPPQEAPEGERYLLGEDDAGRAHFAVLARPDFQLEAAAGASPRALREVGALLGDRDSGLFTHAVALANWHLTHRFCPGCGAPTRIAAAGHVRVCEREGSEHFPRTDPAVIMLVHGTFDGEDKCLLAHNPQWPGPRYSVLAGFVEAGESLEQAVIREVAEEVGVAVVEPTYLGSQPWPFPRSLMLGYSARAVGTAPRTDHTEIAEVRWFTRAQLSDAAARGEVLLPGSVSIARKLIEHWVGEPLHGEW